MIDIILRNIFEFHLETFNVVGTFLHLLIIHSFGKFIFK